MKVSLADRLGNVRKERIGFSVLHFFSGPIYCIANLRFFTAIFEILYIYYLTPIPGMNFIADAVKNLTFIPAHIQSIIVRILMLFRLGRGNHYYVFGIAICFLLHIFFSFRIRTIKVRRIMKKKQLLPLEEIDARKLIEQHVVSVDIVLAEAFDLRQSNTYKSAEENWYVNNQNRLKKKPSFENRSTLSLTQEDRYRTRIEQVENSYKLGLISKNEYERKIKNIKERK